MRDNTNLFMCHPPNPGFLKDLVFSLYNEKNIGYGLIKVENCQKYFTNFGENYQNKDIYFTRIIYGPKDFVMK